MVGWRGEEDGGEVAGGWKADVLVEIDEHNHFKGEEIG